VNIKTVTKELTSANILRMTAGTNTPQGGDAGHGGVTVFSLEDIAGTGWDIEIITDSEVISIDQPKKIILKLYGDCEAETFTRALIIAGVCLNEQIIANRLTPLPRELEEIIPET